MDRRAFLGTTALASASCAFGSRAIAREPRRMNLLLILVDDLNTCLGAYGHPLARTPHLDRLAARGLRFASAFCTYPLCGPSRSAILTGRRPEQLGMYDNEFCWRDAHPGIRTLPQLARDAGYRTERIGKVFHHGISRANPVDPGAEGFRLPHTHTDPASWDAEWGGSYSLHEQLAQGPTALLDGPPLGGTSLHTVRATNDESLPDLEIAERAIAFLRSERARNPFVLGVGFHKPHVPLIAPESAWAAFDAVPDEALDAAMGPTAATPATLPEGTLKDARFHRGLAPEQRRHALRGYLACIHHMDTQLGRVLAALEDSGRAGDTLVAFVADHGYHTGQQGQWDKMMLLDPSLRVPLVLAGPGVPRGAACAAVVESIDLFPTLRRLLGCDESQATDGRDLGPWIADPARPSDRAAFACVATPQRRGWSVRTATHRFGLTSWRGGAAQPYLFDVVADPCESRNLAGGAEFATIEADLRRLLEEHSACAAGVGPGV